MIAETVYELRDELVLRRHYRLPPNDPRLLSLTEEDLAIEVELLYALRPDEPAQLGTCEVCHGQTYRTYCPWCPDMQPLSRLERLARAEEQGETVDWTAYDREVWGQVDADRARRHPRRSGSFASEIGAR